MGEDILGTQGSRSKSPVHFLIDNVSWLVGAPQCLDGHETLLVESSIQYNTINNMNEFEDKCEGSPED